MILLDTHTAIWLLGQPENLSQSARVFIEQGVRAGEHLACSLISLYEAGYAGQRGRLQLAYPVESFLAQMQERFDWLPLTAEIALSAASLPAPFHGDPMDRFIAATAIVHKCPLITADRRIHEAGVCRAIW
jgi:PIN domain nuclease of toxin-antitoxin system